MRSEKVSALRIELSEKEAEVLCALVGGVRRAGVDTTDIVITSFFSELDSFLGAKRETSFVDFFEGRVSTKEKV